MRELSPNFEEWTSRNPNDFGGFQPFLLSKTHTNCWTSDLQAMWWSLGVDTNLCTHWKWLLKPVTARWLLRGRNSRICRYLKMWRLWSRKGDRSRLDGRNLLQVPKSRGCNTCSERTIPEQAHNFSWIQKISHFEDNHFEKWFLWSVALVASTKTCHTDSSWTSAFEWVFWSFSTHENQQCIINSTRPHQHHWHTNT